VLPPGQQEGRLPPQRAVVQAVVRARHAVEKKQRVADPADLPPPGQVGGPARPRSAPIAPRPVQDPGLSLRRPSAWGSREIAQPGEAVQAHRENTSFGGTASRGWSPARRSARRRNGSCPAISCRPATTEPGKRGSGRQRKPRRAGRNRRQRRQPVGPRQGGPCGLRTPAGEPVMGAPCRTSGPVCLLSSCFGGKDTDDAVGLSRFIRPDQPFERVRQAM
jgi:hypothetical protein